MMKLKILAESGESFILLIKALLSAYHLPLYDLTFNYMM